MPAANDTRTSKNDMMGPGSYMSRQFGMAVAMTFALAAATPASSQNPPSSSTPSPAAQQQSGTPVAPVPQDQTAAARAKADAQGVADKQEARIAQEVTKWSAIAQAASAVLVTVFTGVLVWYSHRGWQVAKTAADAAKRSADAAFKSLSIVERPYIDVGDWSLAGMTEHQTNFLFSLKATGRTPATVIGGEIRLSIDEPIEVKAHLDPRFAQPVVQQVVTHLMERPQIVSFPALPLEARTAWKAGLDPGRKMYLGGMVRYSDPFPETPIHVKHFSVVCLGPNGGFMENQLKMVRLNYEEDEQKTD